MLGQRVVPDIYLMKLDTGKLDTVPNCFCALSNLFICLSDVPSPAP